MGWIEAAYRRLMIGLIVMYAGLFFMAGVGGVLGEIVFLSASHVALGVAYNQPKLYVVIGAACLTMVFGPIFAIGVTPYLLAKLAWQVLFFGNPIYRMTTLVEWLGAEGKFVSKSQAKIARVLLTVGLAGLAYGLCMPITATMACGALGLAAFAGHLSYMPVSLINKSLLLKRVGILVGGVALSLAAIAIMVSGLTMVGGVAVGSGRFICGIYVFVASYMPGIFLRECEKQNQITALQRAGSTLLDGHTFEDVERNYKNIALIIQDQRLAAEQRQRDLVVRLEQIRKEREARELVEKELDLKLEGVAAGTLEDMKAYLSHTGTKSDDKEKFFLKVVKKDPAGREAFFKYVIEQEVRPGVHIKAFSVETNKQCLEWVYDQMVWLNGDIEVAVRNLKTTALFILNPRAAFIRELSQPYQPYVSPVRDKIQVRELLKKMRSGPRSAEDREAQRRAKAVLENNNQNPVLVQMLNAKSNGSRKTEEELIEIIHKEIRARLLDDMKSNLELECDPAHQDNIKEKTPHAKEILECIENNRQGLIECQDGALSQLRPFIKDNNTMQAVVAWRMYDPHVPTGSYPSLLLVSNDTTSSVYSTNAVIDGEVTRKKVSGVIRKDAAFCYLKAVHDDLSVNGGQGLAVNDAWQRFVGVISSAGRANNNDDNGYGSDQRTCFPGFKTRLGEFLGGSFENKLKQIIAQHIEVAFGRSMKDPNLNIADKKALYDAVMLLEGVDARILQIGGYYLASNISQEDTEKVKAMDPRIAGLMRIRKRFIEQAFDVTGADIQRISKKIVDKLKEWEIVVQQEQIVYHVEHHLLQMYCTKESITNLYQQHVINGGEKVVTVATVVNPFGQEKPTWDTYKTKTGYEQKPEGLQKMLEKQFVTNYLSQALFSALMNAEQSSEHADKAVESVIAVLKSENGDTWMQDQVDRLESKLLDSYFSYMLYAPVVKEALWTNPIDAADSEIDEKIGALRAKKKVPADAMVAKFKGEQAVNEWNLENLKGLQERLLKGQKPMLSSVRSPIQFGVGGEAGSSNAVVQNTNGNRATSPS